MIQNFVTAHTGSQQFANPGNFLGDASPIILASTGFGGVEASLSSFKNIQGPQFIYCAVPLDDVLLAPQCDIAFSSSVGIVLPEASTPACGFVVVLEFDGPLPAFDNDFIRKAVRVSPIPMTGGLSHISGEQVGSTRITGLSENSSFAYAYGFFHYSPNGGNPMYGHISARAVSHDRPVYQPNK